MNISIKNKCLVLVGLKKALNSGIISLGTYHALQNMVIYE